MAFGCCLRGAAAGTEATLTARTLPSVHRAMMQLACQMRRRTTSAAVALAGCTGTRAMHAATALRALSDTAQLRGGRDLSTPSTASFGGAPPATPSASSSATASVSRAFLFRLRQLSVSGAASLDAFARALRIMHNEQNPQRAWEVWQILESAQKEGTPSISRVVEQERDAGAAAATPAAVASPLAPTADLYNLAIQSLCVHAKRADRHHAKQAFHLFQRMVQLGFHVRLTTYRDLMVALSGCGYPRDSGLDEVFQQCKADARMIRTGEKRDHPDAAEGAFCVPLIAFESMLFALTASAPRPAKVALWSSRVASIVASMERLGVAQSQATLNSRMLMAVHARDLNLVHELWAEMKALDIYPNRSVFASLIRMYAGHRGMAGDRGGLEATQLTPADLQQVLQNIPALQAVFAAMEAATSVPPTPPMMEAKIEALMRAFAARKAEIAAAPPTQPVSVKVPHKEALSSPPPDPSAPLDPLQFLRDLLHAYAECENLQYTLSKHAYIYVFCALTEIHAHQEAEAVGNAAYVRRFDVAQRMQTLTDSMARVGITPLPHMIMFSFQLLASPMNLESESAHAAMLALIQQLLRLSLQRGFILQGLLSTEEDMAPLSYRSADDSQLYRQRCTPAMLTQFVCSSLVFADCFSGATALRSAPSKEGAKAVERRNQKRLTLAQQMILANVHNTKEEERCSALSAVQHRAQEGSHNHSSSGETSLSPFAPETPSHLIDGVSDSARLLVAETLRSMLMCLRPRQLFKSPRLSARGAAHLLQIVEAIWEGAGLYGVREQLQAGRAGALLVHALLTVDHPAAEMHLDAFLTSVTESATVPAFEDELLGDGSGANSRARSKARADVWLVNSAVAIEAVQYLIRRRAPLSSLDSLLLRLDQSPAALTKWTFNTPLFYRGVFVAFARHSQWVKVTVYFQRMMQQVKQVDDETIATMVLCVEKSGDRHALEELMQGLMQVQLAMQTPAAEEATHEVADAAPAVAVQPSRRRRRSSRPPRSASVASDSSRLSWTIGPLSLSVLVRAHVRLDAFADSRPANGFAASRSGEGTLAAAEGVLEDFSGRAHGATASTPLAAAPALAAREDIAVALRLLKCALLVGDETSAARVVQYLQNARPAVAEIESCALDNTWPPVLDCGLDAPPPFLMQVPPVAMPQLPGAVGADDSSSADHVRFASTGDVHSLVRLLHDFYRGVAEMESATGAVEWQMRTNFDRMAAEATTALATHAIGQPADDSEALSFR